MAFTGETSGLTPVEQAIIDAHQKTMAVFRQFGSAAMMEAILNPIVGIPLEEDRQVLRLCGPGKEQIQLSRPMIKGGAELVCEVMIEDDTQESGFYLESFGFGKTYSVERYDPLEKSDDIIRIERVLRERILPGSNLVIGMIPVLSSKAISEEDKDKYMDYLRAEGEWTRNMAQWRRETRRAAVPITDAGPVLQLGSLIAASSMPRSQG